MQDFGEYKFLCILGVLILVNEVGAPITVQSECTTLTRLAKWVVSGAFTPVLPFSIYFKILCKWEGTMVFSFSFSLFFNFVM
jgi:hypothetical protein